MNERRIKQTRNGKCEPKIQTQNAKKTLLCVLRRLGALGVRAYRAIGIASASLRPSHISPITLQW